MMLLRNFVAAFKRSKRGRQFRGKRPKHDLAERVVLLKKG